MSRPRIIALSIALATVACSSDRVTIHAKIDLPTAARLSPASDVVRIRALIDGSESYDDAAKDLGPSAADVTFSDYPNSRTFRLTLSGYDANDNLVAYGEASGEIKTDNVELKIPFRRMLGYVTHRGTCEGGCPSGQVCASPLKGPFICVETASDCTQACSGGMTCIHENNASSCASTWPSRMTKAPGLLYVVDIGARALLETLPLPGTHPRGIGVFARGGDGVWVVFHDDKADADDSGGRAVFLSSSDHTFGTPIRLPAAHEVVVASPNQRYAAAAGGGSVSLIDQEAGTVTRTLEIGGTVLDVALGGEGQRNALFVTTAGLIQIALDQPESTDGSPPGNISNPAGVAVDAEGRIAYVSSGLDGTVLEVDLFIGASKLSDGAFFPLPGGAMTFANGVLMTVEGGARPQHVMSYEVAGVGAIPGSVGVLPKPSSIVSTPGGGQVVVISSGTSSATAGLTIIDPTVPPTASTVTYYRDPDDLYRDPAGPMFHERYQPRKLAILYGQ